ncbi:MAG TPA: pyridoxal-5'-phosphate-dependent protein subunit beta, partial [Ilumatobacteraceae bacterium]
MTVTADHATAATDEALINQFGLAGTIVNPASLANSVRRFREQSIVLPTFAQLADPTVIDPSLAAGVGKDDPSPANLWRVHWYNDLRGQP